MDDNIGDTRSNEGLIRNLTWGDINFVHTTDTHGWYSGHFNQKQYNANWGDLVSFTSNLREKAHKQGQDLLIIDTGDRHDGNGLSDITVPNGNKSLPIFAKQHYDLLTIGNHELYQWEISELEYNYVVDHYKDNYVNTNVEILVDNQWLDFGNKFKYFTTPINGYRILSFGFLFDFNRNNNHTRVTPINEVIQTTWFSNILDQFPESQVDYLVIIGHIPVTHEWIELNILHRFLRKYYPNIVIQYFGGHSHIRDFIVYDDKLTALESGRFCETVGWVSINDTGTDLKSTFSRSYIDFNIESFKHHTKYENFDTKLGNQVKQLIRQTREELQLSAYIGSVSNNYYMDYVPVDHRHNIFRLLSERVLPTLEYSPNSNPERIIIINTGSVRYDLYKGNYTSDTKYIISPFKNDWVRLTIPKHLANLVAGKLNEGSYINLLPAHQMAMKLNSKHIVKSNLPNQYPIKKLTKGYVTYDDFGNDGDDTLHYGTINFPLPHVVESVQFTNNDDTNVDLVFYNFLTWNVVDALLQLTGKDYSNQIEFYSETYLSNLLTNYVKNNNI